jgi:hypothetical protein
LEVVIVDILLTCTRAVERESRDVGIWFQLLSYYLLLLFIFICVAWVQWGVELD